MMVLRLQEMISDLGRRIKIQIAGIIYGSMSRSKALDFLIEEARIGSVARKIARRSDPMAEVNMVTQTKFSKINSKKERL